MSFMPADPSGRALTAEVNTSGYRISGTIHSRANRIAGVLNNLDHSHVTIELATIRELYDPGRGRRAASALVPQEEILFIVADMPPERMEGAIVVPKRPIQAQIALPPFRLSGSIFVPEGIESVSTAVTTSTDRFIPMVDVTVTCWIRAELNASYPLLAFQRDRVQVMSFDDAAADPLAGLRPTSEGSGWS